MPLIHQLKGKDAVEVFEEVVHRLDQCEVILKQWTDENNPDYFDHTINVASNCKQLIRLIGCILTDDLESL